MSLWTLWNRKSEAAISLAVKRRRRHQVTLGDLDIVNVYFRSRKAEFLERWA